MLVLTHFFLIKYLKIWKTLIITTVIPPRFISIELIVRATYFTQPWLIHAKDMVERRFSLALNCSSDGSKTHDRSAFHMSLC